MPQDEALQIDSEQLPNSSPSLCPQTSGWISPAADFSLLDSIKHTVMKAEYRHPKRAKVLLVEDDRTMRRIVSASLKSHCDLTTARNITEGFSLYNSLNPDIVFMDIELPESDGYGLLALLLWDDPSAFVVMFSGHSDNNNVMRSLETGAKGFVSKPFDVHKMLYFINESIATH